MAKNGKGKNGHDVAFYANQLRDEYVLKLSPTILSGLLMRRMGTVEDQIPESIRAAGMIYDSVTQNNNIDGNYVLENAPVILMGMLTRRSGSSIDLLLKEAIAAATAIYDAIMENKVPAEGMFSQPIGPIA